MVPMKNHYTQAEKITSDFPYGNLDGDFTIMVIRH